MVDKFPYSSTTYLSSDSPLGLTMLTFDQVFDWNLVAGSGASVGLDNVFTVN